MSRSRMFAGLAVACSVGVAFASAPTVSNVQFNQDELTRAVTVTYELDAPAIVTVDFQTNGVSVGAANFTPVSGDVNAYVTKRAGTIHWAPHRTWPGHRITDGSMTAVVTAWELASPPDYLAMDMLAHTTNWYTCADAVPGGVTNDLYKTSAILLRRIPAANVQWKMGQYNMSGEDVHSVTLTGDYYMGVFQVTDYQYEFIKNGVLTGTKLPKETPSGVQQWNVTYVRWRGDSSDGKNWPTVGGRGASAGSVLGLLSQKTGIEFDLPTEAEWEFAARAGCGDERYDADLNSIAWTSDNYANDPAGYAKNQKHEVGLLKPNAFGLYDVLGNVWEYCLDWHDSGYYGGLVGTVTSNPKGPDSGTVRVKRGGSYENSSSGTVFRLAKRSSEGPAANASGVGARVVAPLMLKW